MTVSSTTNPLIRSLGNGITTAFPTTFVFDTSSDLVVILTGTNGTDTAQIITTHYTVTGGSGATGTVTMITPPASGEYLTIYRDTGLTQELDLVENDQLPAETLEAAFDKLTYIAQENRQKLSRAILFSETSGLTGQDFPDPEADAIIGWDVNGEVLENKSLADIDAYVMPIDAGILTQTTAGTAVARTITAGTVGGISVTNGSGVSGNPTVDLSITGLTAEASPDSSNDFVVMYDASAGTNKKVTVANIRGSSATVGGSNTQIQYNNAGGFGGDSGFVTNGAGSVDITGDLDVDNIKLNGNTISATDAGGSINFQASTTGTFNFLSTASQSSKLVLYEDTDNGTDTITIQPPASLAGAYTLTLPTTDGASGEFLSTDGSGVLSWTASSATAASQAEMEAASSTVVTATPGRLQYHPGVAKAWLKCDATGTINASHNITSITDTGTGIVDVTIATDFSSANYVIIGGALYNSRTVTIMFSAQAAGTCTVWGAQQGGSAIDPTSYFITMFGDQ